jgi:tight adherence protein B
MSQTLIRLALLLAIFASAFLLSQVVLGAAWRNREKVAAINRRLRMIRQGGSRAEVVAILRKNAEGDFSAFPPLVGSQLRRLQRLLFTAAAPFTLMQVLMAMLALFVLVCLILAAMARASGFPLNAGVLLLSFVIAVSVGVVLPAMIISIIAQRRRHRVEQQFPVALDVFVRALRSGHPIASAVELLTSEMEDPIGSEFGLVADEVSYGAELADALAAMAERWNLDDMRMFVVSISVQSETGGNLAEILENLADVIRARASMYMKVRALSSEGRMTGWMLTVLPIFAFVSMFLTNPQFYMDVAKDSIFLIGFPALILLYFVGVFTIRQMTNLKV